MTQQQLRDYLDRFMETLGQQDRELLDSRLQSLVSVFPFSAYVSENRHLNLYGLAPRIIGQIWGEQPSPQSPAG